MAVTKQTYTAAATWTASQLAGIFRSAFIDAGLMTDWHDSFLSGSVENRILRVVYDGTKTYGTTFYWFMFTTGGVFLHVATGWNTSTKVPTGTQYLDFFSTTTNSTANHWQLSGSFSTLNTAELVRYTSNIDTNQSWFVLKSSTLRTLFTITSNAEILQPWLDLDKGFYNGFFRCLPRNDSSYPGAGAVVFFRGPSLRRDLIIGSALKGNTTASDYSATCAQTFAFMYGAVGNLSNSVSTNMATFNNGYGGSGDFRHNGAILLPVNFSDNNPAFSSNSNPVFHSLTFSPYTTNSLPSDFGITFHYATNSFSQGDTFVVNSGTEEWEILNFAANSSAVTGASPLFLARTI